MQFIETFNHPDHLCSLRVLRIGANKALKRKHVEAEKQHHARVYSDNSHYRVKIYWDTTPKDPSVL